jgi:dsDNA-binding SOS-regulon protein
MPTQLEGQLMEQYATIKGQLDVAEMEVSKGQQTVAEAEEDLRRAQSALRRNEEKRDQLSFRMAKLRSDLKRLLEQS